MQLFETSFTDEPFVDRTWIIDRFTIGIFAGFSEIIAWSDFQGVGRFTLEEGEIDIASISIQRNLLGESRTLSVSIPEPANVSLFLASITMLYAFQRRIRK
jgi:hypothetical protein